MGCASDGKWFGKPSYLGLYAAAKPWGPWTQIYEEATWAPDKDLSARAYQPQIAPKWIASDGKSFWLVWTDHQSRCEPSWYQQAEEAAGRLSRRDAVRLRRREMVRCMPYYAFNTQRFDLIVT